MIAGNGGHLPANPGKKKKKKSRKAISSKSFQEIDEELRTALDYLIQHSKDLTKRSNILGERLKAVLRKIQEHEVEEREALEREAEELAAHQREWES